MAYFTVGAVSLTVRTDYLCSRPCISVHTGARSTVGALKPDRAFNVHKLLISTFILGHGVYETHCYWDSGLPCIFLQAITLQQLSYATGGKYEEDLTNKAWKPWPVTHRTQTTLSLFTACVPRTVLFRLVG